MTVKGMIERTLGSFAGLVWDDDVVSVLAAKVEGTHPDNPVACAYVVARNWALDQRRRLQSSNRLQVKAWALKQKELEEAQKHARIKTEWTQLCEQLRVSMKKGPLREFGLVYAECICIDRMIDPDCATLFPGTSRDQRYQWLKRIRDMVIPLASEELKRFLMKHIGEVRAAKR